MNYVKKLYNPLLSKEEHVVIALCAFLYVGGLLYWYLT